MKTSRLSWTFVLPVAALTLAQCSKKEEPAAGGEPSTAEKITETVAEVAEELQSDSLSAEERAAIAEIAGMVRGDVDGVASLIDPQGAVEKLRQLKLWEFIRSVARSEGGVDPEQEIAEGASEVAPFAGENLSIVYGKGTSDFIKIYVEAGQRMNYHQFRSLTKAFAEGLVTGDISGAMMQMEGGSQFAGLIEDVDDFLPQLRDLEIPPVLLTTKISDEAVRQQAFDQISDMLGMVGQQGEPLTFEAAGARFSGYRLSGEMIATQMEADPAGLNETFGEETAAELIDIVRGKRVVVAAGQVGSFLSVYLGTSEEDCPLTQSIGDSLAANGAISFVDAFKDKDVHGFLYGSQEALDSAFRTDGMAQIAAGVIAGLKEAEGFGDPRELIALLGLVGEREKELYSFFKPDTLGGVISVDGGLSFDAYGGYNARNRDYDSPHKLGALGDGERTLLFADSVISPEYNEAMTDYIDLLVTIAYSAAEHVAGLGAPQGDMPPQWAQMFQLFDERFREDMLKLWNGLQLADEGLGTERAFVVDLAGSVPSLPGVPPAVVENGRMPRASYVAPVSDRAKLGESWKEIDAAVRSMLATARELGAGENLNMLVPTNSEKNDYITWYFDAAAFSDDLKPSVTISDGWFAASTSRNQALDLLGRAAAGAESDRKGMWIKLDTDVLADYLEDLATLVDENGEQIIPDPSGLEEFRAKLPQIREGIEAFREFDAVTIHERREGGRSHATFRISAD